jgi:hypothetical protein
MPTPLYDFIYNKTERTLWWQEIWLISTIIRIFSLYSSFSMCNLFILAYVTLVIIYHNISIHWNWKLSPCSCAEVFLQKISTRPGKPMLYNSYNLCAHLASFPVLIFLMKINVFLLKELQIKNSMYLCYYMLLIHLMRQSYELAMYFQKFYQLFSLQC